MLSIRCCTFPFENRGGVFPNNQPIRKIGHSQPCDGHRIVSVMSEAVSNDLKSTAKQFKSTGQRIDGLINELKQM
jgi:hypothetical protein